MILSMAWSSLAHLPTNEDEYWYILSNLENGMSIKEVDTIIAAYKNKVKVQHHYRSNLAKLGVYKIENNCIILNYDVNELVKERNLLKDMDSENFVKFKHEVVEATNRLIIEELN